jgi:flagellar basal-body rod protein FlgF
VTARSARAPSCWARSPWCAPPTWPFRKDGDNLYRNTTNDTPQAAPDAAIHQGMLEASNVQSITQITKLIEVSRAYESVAKMMDQTSELSRSAVERMGKVQ